MNLRDYQQRIVDRVHGAWCGDAPFPQAFKRVLVVSPTGSGKTICFSALSAFEHDADRNTLILVDQEELVTQALDKLRKSTGIVGQAEQAERSASHRCPVVVATVQSMMRRLDRWPKDHFSLVVADEADKSITPSWQSVLQHFNARVCGFTATPNRTDKKSLGAFYEVIADEVDFFSLVRAGYLAPVTVQMLPVSLDMRAVTKRAGDYDATELDSVIRPHLEQVVGELAKRCAFRKTLVFLPLIRTSETFVEIARAHGINAEHIDGTSEDRAEKLSRFARGDFDMLCNSALLTRGYDDCMIDCVVPLRPTKSETLYAQMVGRGTRIASGKRDLLLIDFLYQSSRHKLCRPACLIAEDEAQAKIITELTEQAAGMPGDVAQELDLQTVAAQASSQREESLRKKLDEHGKKRGKYISSEEFALLHHAPTLADYAPAMEWEASSVTVRQVKYLKRAKIDPATVKDRGHASKLLDLHFKSAPSTGPGDGVVKLMHRMAHTAAQCGISEPAMASPSQVGQFFSLLRAKS